MKRSKFVLTHDHSTTLDMGCLVPFLLLPTLPGDRFRISLSSFIRCQPMVAPLMHVVNLYTQYWYVPYRILWTQWEDFITGGENLDSAPAFPQITAPSSGFVVGSLADYFGFPVGQGGIKVSAMPFRAMAEIWNTRYRDEDLQSEVPISYGNGNDSVTNTSLLSPSWKKDYFTIARPFTQRGADITVPITSSDSGSPVYHLHSGRFNYFVLGPSNILDYSGCTVEVTNTGNNGLASTGTYSFDTNSTGFMNVVNSCLRSASGWVRESSFVPSAAGIDVNSFLASSGPGTTISHYPINGTVTFTNDHSKLFKAVFTGLKVALRFQLDADKTVPNKPSSPNYVVKDNLYISSTSCQVYLEGFSDVTANVSFGVTLNTSGEVSIRDIRLSSSLQRYAERSLRWGNRYEEFLMREFGVRPKDSRIQRPEYIGGGRGILSISEVLQTAESTDNSVGTMRGHGVSSLSQKRIRFSSPEHGLIIGLLSIRPQAVYTQGINREWLKKSRLDFFTPELANIGMQEVLQQELFATSSNAGAVFGYSERYQEYRRQTPRVTGEFRDLLDFWNLARKFANPPNLNDEFINMAYSTELFKRPFAIQDQSYHSFLAMLRNNIVAYRPVPKVAKDILK